MPTFFSKRNDDKIPKSASHPPVKNKIPTSVSLPSVPSLPSLNSGPESPGSNPVPKSKSSILSSLFKKTKNKDASVTDPRSLTRGETHSMENPKSLSVDFPPQSKGGSLSEHRRNRSELLPKSSHSADFIDEIDNAMETSEVGIPSLKGFQTSVKLSKDYHQGIKDSLKNFSTSLDAHLGDNKRSDADASSQPVNGEVGKIQDVAFPESQTRSAAQNGGKAEGEDLFRSSILSHPPRPFPALPQNEPESEGVLLTEGNPQRFMVSPERFANPMTHRSDYEEIEFDVNRMGSFTSSPSRGGFITQSARDFDNSMHSKETSSLSDDVGSHHGGSGSHHVSISRDNSYSSSIRSWTKGEKLGEGGFGAVYRCLNDETGQSFAVKQVPRDTNHGSIRAQQSLEQLKQEVALLSRLHHPNIVQYLGSDMDDDFLYIFLEYVECGSIRKIIDSTETSNRKGKKISETLIRTYTRQILAGLDYLHQMGTVHRDIKCSNILVDKFGNIKLADFGVAKVYESNLQMTACRGTVWWMAPEAINPCKDMYKSAVDIWSLGCTVIEMASRSYPWIDPETQRTPWGSIDQTTAIFKIANTKVPPPIPPHLSPAAYDFVERCLQIKPSDRPSATELLHHPFIKTQTIPSPMPPASPTSTQEEYSESISSSPRPRAAPSLNPEARFGASPTTETLVPPASPPRGGPNSPYPISVQRSPLSPQNSSSMSPRGYGSDSSPRFQPPISVRTKPPGPLPSPPGTLRSPDRSPLRSPLHPSPFTNGSNSMVPYGYETMDERYRFRNPALSPTRSPSHPSIPPPDYYPRYPPSEPAYDESMMYLNRTIESYSNEYHPEYLMDEQGRPGRSTYPGYTRGPGRPHSRSPIRPVRVDDTHENFIVREQSGDYGRPRSPMRGEFYRENPGEYAMVENPNVGYMSPSRARNPGYASPIRSPARSPRLSQGMPPQGYFIPTPGEHHEEYLRSKPDWVDDPEMMQRDVEMEYYHRPNAGYYSPSRQRRMNENDMEKFSSMSMYDNPYNMNGVNSNGYIPNGGVYGMQGHYSPQQVPYGMSGVRQRRVPQKEFSEYSYSNSSPPISRVNELKYSPGSGSGSDSPSYEPEPFLDSHGGTYGEPNENTLPSERSYGKVHVAPPRTLAKSSSAPVESGEGYYGVNPRGGPSHSAFEESSPLERETGSLKQDSTASAIHKNMGGPDSFSSRPSDNSTPPKPLNSQARQASLPATSSPSRSHWNEFKERQSNKKEGSQRGGNAPISHRSAHIVSQRTVSPHLSSQNSPQGSPQSSKGASPVRGPSDSPNHLIRGKSDSIMLDVHSSHFRGKEREAFVHGSHGKNGTQNSIPPSSPIGFEEIVSKSVRNSR